MLSWPLVRHLNAMRLRRLVPLDRGAPRGTSVVRYYHDRFLVAHRADIRGRCLEVGETAHIRRFGSDAVTSAEAIDLARHSPEVTVVADLTCADHVAGGQFDCFIVPFVMTVIHDPDAAIHHAVRLLRPGGVLLVNFGCVDYYLADGLDMGTGDVLHMHRWFTPLDVHNVLHRAGLGDRDYEMTVYGNLMSRIAFLTNMSAEELTNRELDTVDPGQPLLVCARIERPEGWDDRPIPTRREPYVPPGTPRQLSSRTGHYADAYG